MDLNVAIAQFFNKKGEITLPPQLTLAGMAEMMYQLDVRTGGDVDRVCMRHWDYSESAAGTPIEFTRKEINTRVKAVAARLQQVGKIGDRVAILAGNSPEYLFGFLGATYAGMTPIPLYDPNEPGHTDHLKSVFADAQPAIVLTNSLSAAAVRKHFSDVPAKERPRIIVVDAVADSLADGFVDPLQTPEGRALASNTTISPVEMTAFLQYTSGSTRNPAGVVLSNRSILTNVLQIFRGAEIKVPLRIVTWLPLHHDMGIILAVFATVIGQFLETMTPRDFVQQPSRWIRQLQRRDGDEERGTWTVVPNFALELAARYAKPEEGAEVDFSNVSGLVVGSEPVTEAAVTSFLEAFESHNFDRNVIRPSYGLAEASLLVSTPDPGMGPVVSYFDREKLGQGHAELTEKSADSVAFISNGRGVPAQYLTLVDPATKAELPDGEIGEIWLHGDNRAQEYLGRPEESQETFHNTLGTRLEEGSRVEGAPEDDNWLATGDLGVIIDGQLYITGRLKDLIVVAGRNHYPQDIEGTVQEASAHVRPDSVAAFSVEGDNTEKLVILVERADRSDAADDAAATDAIRAAVSKNHGLTPDVVKFFAPNEINRTSSGKIARRVAKKHYLAN
ncbi:acyl-CoA synthase [Corynebacterium phocae]|uniref:Acyl-CoA synthase n=1 Tax=Corynebacterium phocae TaxID=161895 RepID=A0A1L7D5F5_9CORY|nr:FadD32-like long-chain-fatty-acid--AMP ligase [Corynebacterium phocae]APT93396.1 acyl-CoA synthase [Corynebacterium phocae]KAA8721738.1 AMP-binding protein [Corynebacterium phocae]